MAKSKSKVAITTKWLALVLCGISGRKVRKRGLRGVGACIAW